MKSRPLIKKSGGRGKTGDSFEDRYGIERDQMEFERELYQMGLDYHIRCEAYDQAVCVARDHRGIAIPTTAAERGLISGNARRVRMELELEAQKMGATASQLWKAIQLAAREDFPIPAPAILVTYAPGLRPFGFENPAFREVVSVPREKRVKGKS